MRQRSPTLISPPVSQVADCPIVRCLKIGHAAVSVSDCPLSRIGQPAALPPAASLR